MSFLLFILLVLFLMIGIPLLRGWLYMNSLRRRVNETFGGRQERQQRDEEDDDGKIFDSTDGEYADFEEGSGTIVEETTSTGDTRTIVEEQVTDAEYEEIQ